MRAPSCAAHVPPCEKPSRAHDVRPSSTRRFARIHAGTSTVRYVSEFPREESMHMGFASDAPSWSGMTTMGARPWWSAA
ncbi:hypothetical protein BC477_15015 [Clavibacter michiganensis subsp. michiganensis]|uniref:Uncharacterized protein n=1 Tax=Clavibacter michiganensis subsp. michiganensis TaxID=33013 RepID=A0A251XCH5_CLAMM|nr:hypothetical protein BC477_15015 [Clavibacter michiganensis subsp. michiganensis]OUD99850.1 hypothetical protein CMMCAS07_20460 [Clavibacter michiganensis subsp. michiganensis]